MPTPPQVGQVVLGHKFLGGDPKQPTSWQPLTGEDYLATIPQERANIVRGIIQGRVPYPNPARQTQSSGPQFANQLIQDVGMTEPGFDATIYKERQTARNSAIADYSKSTVGSTGGKIISANQIMRHAQTLMSKLPQTNNADFTPSNYVLNTLGDTFGGNQLKPYSLARDALVAESEKFFSGNAPTEGRMKDLATNLSPSGSYQQKTAALGTLMELVAGQLDPLAKRFTELTGIKKNPEDLLEPNARAIYLKLKAMNPEPQQPQGTQQQPMLQQMQSQYPTMQRIGQQPQQQAQHPIQVPANNGWSIQRVN